MDHRKLEVIESWSAPMAIAKLRSFLGLTNYYRKFIGGYASMTNPLTNILKNGADWTWSKECGEAFQKLKDAIVTAPMLQLSNFELPFEVLTDALDRAIGGVLMQEHHMLAFKSRKIKDCE